MPTGFPRQGYWSQLSVPSPGDLPDPGIKPTSLALAGRFFTTDPHGKPTCIMGNPHLFPVIVLFIGYFQQLFLVFWNVIMFFSWAIIWLLQPEGKKVCVESELTVESLQPWHASVDSQLCDSWCRKSHSRTRWPKRSGVLAQNFSTRGTSSYWQKWVFLVVLLLFRVYARKYLFCTLSAECMRCNTVGIDFFFQVHFEWQKVMCTQKK